MKLTTESTVVNDKKINTDIDNAQTTADGAQATADDAKTIATDTAQYFWFASSGTDTGAHISEQTRADFEANPSGGNLLANSNGIAVRDGMTELATFGATAKVGKSAGGHIEIDSSALSYYIDDTKYARFGGWAQLGNDTAVHLKASGDGLEFAGTNGRKVFDIHLNGTTSTRYISERFNSTMAALAGTPVTGTNINARFTDSTTNADSSYTFTAGTDGAYTYSKGSSSYTATYTASTQTITMSGSNSPKVVRVSYATAFPNLYTSIGTRSFGDDDTDTATAGIFSLTQGLQCYASGEASTALNYGTKAAGDYQTAIGKWNVEDTTSLFIIGKGVSATNRANAFSVASDGTVYVNGTSVHSSDRRLKEHIAYLGDEAVEFIDGLKPAHYIKDGKKHVGFYAQDVKEVDKWDCMLGEEMNGYMTLSYMDLIAPLVKYVQKLEKRIEELERDNK